jgi:hypothetical protein
MSCPYRKVNSDSSWDVLIVTNLSGYQVAPGKCHTRPSLKERDITVACPPGLLHFGIKW